MYDSMYEPNEDTEICNDGSCPGWGTWGHWSGCDATCDSGEQELLLNLLKRERAIHNVIGIASSRRCKPRFIHLGTHP